MFVGNRIDFLVLVYTRIWELTTNKLLNNYKTELKKSTGIINSSALQYLPYKLKLLKPNQKLKSININKTKLSHSKMLTVSIILPTFQQ